MGVIAGYGVQTSILVQSLGTICFIVNVMSDLLQVLEVRPSKERNRLLAEYTVDIKQGGINVFVFLKNILGILLVYHSV